MATIRCHTVPQFYLNYFLQSGSNLLWVYDKKYFDIRPQSPVNTTVIGDYYLSEPDDRGEKDQRAEKFLSVIEGWAKPILDRLVNRPNSLVGANKDVLAMFIAFTHCRSPRSVQAIKEISEAGVDYALDQVKEIALDSIEMRKLYERFSQKENNESNLSYDEFIQVMKDQKMAFIPRSMKNTLSEKVCFLPK